MVAEVFVDYSVHLASADGWNEVNFTVLSDRSKQNILIDFTVNCDSETSRFD